MTRRPGPFRLAWRLSRAGRRPEVAGPALLGVTALLLTFLALTGLAVPRVLADRADRLVALTPHTDLREHPAPGSLLAFDARAADGPRWNGHEIVRGYFAAGGEAAPRIPGTRSAPGVDEYLASPALQRLISRDETVAGLFGSLVPVGTVAADGLSQPHELRAIIGVPRDGPLLEQVSRFGGRPAASSAENHVLNASILGLVGAMLWLPALALLAVTVRLHVSSRRRRFRSLRLLGLSRRTARLVQAAGCTAAVASGAVVGALVFLVAARTVSTIPGTSFGFYPAAAQLPLRVLLAVAAVVSAVLASAVALAHQDDDAESRSRRRPLRSRSEGVGLTVVVVAVGFLLAMPAVERLVGAPAVFGMWIACVAAAGGLGVAGPRIVQRVSEVLARRARSASLLVGLRLAPSITAATARLGGLACVVIVLMLGSLSFTAILNGGSYQGWADRLAREQKVPLVATDLTGRVRYDDVRRLGVSDGLAEVRWAPLDQPGTGAAAGSDVRIVLASCDDLARLTGRPTERCRAGTRSWINRPAAVPAGLVIPGAGGGRLPPTSRTVGVRGLPDDLDGAVLVDPGPAPPVAGTSSEFLVLADADRLGTSMARISSLAPGVQLDLGERDRLDPDFRQFPQQVEWLAAGCLASFLIAALALLGSILGEAPQRSARLRGLRVLGARRGTLARTHLWSIVVPLTVLGAVATATGLAVCISIRSFDDRAVIPWAAAGCSVIGSAVTAVVLGLLTLRSSLLARRSVRPRSPGR